MKILKRLFIPDSHFPSVDRRAFNLMLDIAAEFKPDEVIYLGDFFDCYSVSQYDKDPNHNFNLLEEELVDGQKALEEVEKRTKAKKFTFLEGNHENRITRYVNAYAAKIATSLSTREILGIPRYYRYLPYGQKGHYRVGNWVATHGTICGKHVASAMISKYGCNVIFGHVHRIQRYQSTNFHGETLTGVTCGWLGDKEEAAEYVKNVADWAHGFALGYFLPSGRGFIETIAIENYEAIFRGELFKR